MSSYARQLLRTADHLMLQSRDDPARTPQSAVRRSISTTYYALFHFLLEQTAQSIVGKDGKLSRRRHVFMRTIAHRGIKLAMSKVTGAVPTMGVASLFKRSDDDPISTPKLIRDFASLFLEAYEQRQQADYDFNVELQEMSAIVLTTRAELAISEWERAEPAATDFKHALLLLIALQGKLRAEGE